MIITQTVHMDLASLGTAPEIHVVQGDTCSRCICVRLAVAGKPWTPPEGVSISLRYGKPDGTAGHYDTLPDGTPACSVADNSMRILLAPQILTVPGRVAAQVEMISAGHLLATFSLHIVVEKDPAFGLAQSRDYLNWLQRVQDSLDAMLRQAQQSGAFQGEQGIPGETPALSIGEVLTLEAGSAATASLTGTELAPKLNLGIPKGADFGLEDENHPGCCYRITDGQTEWINPPMIEGIAYRTTDRWLGRPVCTMLVNLGEWADDKEISVDIGATAHVLRTFGCVGGYALPYVYGGDPASAVTCYISAGPTTTGFSIRMDGGTVTFAGMQAYLQVFYAIL